MAAAVLSAELRLRDGQRRTLSVQSQNRTGTGSGLHALIRALREFSGSVTFLLTELVEREQGHGACAEDKSQDSEDEDEEEPQEFGPEPKRIKT